MVTALLVAVDQSETICFTTRNASLLAFRSVLGFRRDAGMPRFSISGTQGLEEVHRDSEGIAATG